MSTQDPQYFDHAEHDAQLSQFAEDARENIDDADVDLPGLPDADPTAFRLVIELGNAGMSSAYDIAAALRDLASRLDEVGFYAPETVRDANGNTVGDWELQS